MAPSVYSRELFLGEALDTEHIEVSYDAGVLTVRIPLAEQARPPRIEFSATVRPLARSLSLAALARGARGGGHVRSASKS